MAFVSVRSSLLVEMLCSLRGCPNGNVYLAEVDVYLHLPNVRAGRHDMGTLHMSKVYSWDRITVSIGMRAGMIKSCPRVETCLKRDKAKVCTKPKRRIFHIRPEGIKNGHDTMI